MVPIDQMEATGMSKAATAIPADKLELYEKLVTTNHSVERKGEEEKGGQETKELIPVSEQHYLLVLISAGLKIGRGSQVMNGVILRLNRPRSSKYITSYTPSSSPKCWFALCRES